MTNITRVFAEETTSTSILCNPLIVSYLFNPASRLCNISFYQCFCCERGISELAHPAGRELLINSLAKDLWTGEPATKSLEGVQSTDHESCIHTGPSPSMTIPVRIGLYLRRKRRKNRFTDTEWAVHWDRYKFAEVHQLGGKQKILNTFRGRE